MLSVGDHFCGYSEECPTGKLKPVKAEKDISKDVNIAAIVAPIVSIIVLLIIFLFVRFYFGKRRPRKQKEEIEINKTVAVPKPRRSEMMI